MKAHELLSSPDTWCQESLAKDAYGDNVPPFDPEAVQKVYPPSQWEEPMNRVLRALSVSEKGIQQLSKSDKACCVMEWNDQRESSYQEFERFA
jgi:hypothetical protein